MNYQFNGFEIDTLQFKLFYQGKTVAIEPKNFDLILYLIKNRHRAVTRDEIFKTVWQGHIVCDATLSNHIKSIRKILDDNGDDQNVISTIRGRGYQFIAETEEIQDKGPVVFPAITGFKYTYQVAIVIVIAILFMFLVGLIFPKDEAAQIKSNSIAVLPFVNLSKDPDNEYFSKSISEEILNALSDMSGLHVISRSSSFHLKGKEIDVINVAAQLGVAYVLEGSVRKSETKIRISVQLIEVKNDRQIWRTTINREIVDILAVQTEISTAIVVALRNALGANHENTKLHGSCH